MIKSFLKKIFSVVELEDKVHYQITFLGLSLKIRKHCPKSYKSLPINPNKIVFNTNNGTYSCNPKYIAEEIIRRNLPYELVWVTNGKTPQNQDMFPKNMKFVRFGSFECFEEYMTSKVWVENERRTAQLKLGLNKRPEQIYIQTFHGSLGIKKTGKERADINLRKYNETIKDSKQIDYLTSNGKYTTDFFKNIFDNYGNILEFGHPRNDIFFRDTTEIRKKVYDYYKIPEDKKIVMYAPTLREDEGTEYFKLDFENLRNALSKKFGGEWIVLCRLHPLLINLSKCFDFNSPNIINATSYPDIQELLVASEAIVTDYSSCIYDFMLSRKPGFIYATDIEKYSKGRGLYYPLETTPFPIATNDAQMYDVVMNFDMDAYKPAVDEFLKEKGCIDEGKASEKVVDLIEKIISAKEGI